MNAETPSVQNPPQPKPNIEWQLIASKDRTFLWSENCDTTHVAEIPGGWLLRFRHYEGQTSPMSTQAITFIADADHCWAPKERPPRWEILGGVVNAAWVDQTMRLAVPSGWVYKNHFLNRARALTLSLVFVPGADVPLDAPEEVPGQEGAEEPRVATEPDGRRQRTRDR